MYFHCVNLITSRNFFQLIYSIYLSSISIQPSRNIVESSSVLKANSYGNKDAVHPPLFRHVDYLIYPAIYFIYVRIDIRNEIWISRWLVERNSVYRHLSDNIFPYSAISFYISNIKWRHSRERKIKQLFSIIIKLILFCTGVYITVCTLYPRDMKCNVTRTK